MNTPQAVTLPATIPLYIEGLAESAGVKTEEIRVIFTAAGVPEMQDVVPVTVVNFDMAVDGDRNRTIDFREVKDESYLFWVNNDRDTDSWSWSELRNVEDDKESGNDSADIVISCLRDLEDFARLQVKLSGNIPSGLLTYKMQTVQDVGGNALPQINLFKAVEVSDKYLGIEYHPDEGDHQPADQLLKKLLGIVMEQPMSLTSDIIEPGQVSPFLFEGRGKGRGHLRITANYAGVPVLERNVTLAIEDISYFYDHFIVSESGNVAAPVNAAVNPVGLGAGASREGRYQPSSDEYVLFVHGWNVQPWKKQRWAETVFKRLWWQGFKGRIGMFDWPSRTLPSLDVHLNYDRSEYLAWHSAEALEKLLESLNQRHPDQVRLLAHSMGNVVAGEAINFGPVGLVHSYVASQAAISASFYHQNETDITPMLEAFTYETPEVIGNYPDSSPTVSYWSGVPQKVGRLLSYFNRSDYALNTGNLLFPGWEDNNKTKPDDSAGYVYLGNPATYPNPPSNGEGFVLGHVEFTEQEPIFVVDRELRFPADRYEIFAFGAESRTKALGAVQALPEFIVPSNNIDLNGSRNLEEMFQFDNTHYSHSRQFRSNIIAEQGYWRAFVKDSGLN